MATKTDPFTPTNRLKGNSMKAKPEFGHGQDYLWMGRVGYEVASDEYGGAYKGFLNDNTFQLRSTFFEIDEWVQYIAQQFVNSGANQRQQTGMTRAINETLKNTIWNVEMLGGMAEFALRNPDVECVMPNMKGNRRGMAFFGNLPDELGLIDGYAWTGTNYVEFRKWLWRVGNGSEQAGLAKVKSLPYLINSAGDIFKAMVKGQRTDCEVVRTILINRTIQGYASGPISPHEASIGLSFLDVCRDVWRRISQRGSWFSWEELGMHDKPATFNPLSLEQQETMREAMQHRADYCLEMHNRWISAMS